MNLNRVYIHSSKHTYQPISAHVVAQLFYKQVLTEKANPGENFGEESVMTDLFPSGQLPVINTSLQP